ncbi:hypothetical protein THAOC_31388 [Thalassiosira oceanica]|uniref:Uncharacterized protein n=1 Tax=Thalassiosira oceanica TaxID=159749 RepID=K0RBV4_THAOC|nr:hypothetical protein THAOC_31388 [Thalassiosira oceanica]|eukprot:EJK49704.1 hypothetical protein THAOC_31388 [Thalassiosira oceanica]
MSEERKLLSCAARWRVLPQPHSPDHEIFRGGAASPRWAGSAVAFTSPSRHSAHPRAKTASLYLRNAAGDETTSSDSSDECRRTFLSRAATAAAIAGVPSRPAFAEGEQKSEAFESIAARAAKVNEEVINKENELMIKEEAAEQRKRELAQQIRDDPRTIYDFTLPVAGREVQVTDLVGQTFETVGEEGSTKKIGSKVKAILVVNIKQDDPIARKNIPELIALASKFGKSGEFAVIISPTDQGYFEADTSVLLRLKVQSEYGWGSTPGTILTDKVNLLGSGAVPFWRWLEGSCRTPQGLGKIQANFEKFLVDGRTGKALRRYPRKYQPYDIADDIAALIAGKTLPPAGANFKEEWRNAAKEAENDTYRFQKGLNYFDQ